MILYNTSRRVVGSVLVNISPSKIFLAMVLPARFLRDCQTDFGPFGH